MSITLETLKLGLTKVAAHMETCADELNAVDGQIGDGDIGVTMTLAGRAVTGALDDLPEDLGQAFMKIAMTINKAASSSYGTLVSTAFMALAKKYKGETEIAWSDATVMLDTARELMASRGKSELGAKTVLDAMDYASREAAGLDDPNAILDAMLAGVDKALADFKDKPNKVGRARIWAEKSVGLDDPGMVAFKRILDGLREA